MNAPKLLTKVALSLALLVACGGGDGDDGVDADPNAPSEIVERTVELDIGRFAEASIAMAVGARAEIWFDSTGGPVLWDVHGHQDGVTMTFLEGENETLEQVFESPEDGNYYFQWGNNNEAAVSLDVRIELYGNAALIDWIQ